LLASQSLNFLSDTVYKMTPKRTKDAKRPVAAVA